jgi:hypothetical protein
MEIFIPTKGRIERQDTWDNLPPCLQEVTVLVCPEEEVEQHRARGRRVIARPNLPLSGVRQWLCDKTVGTATIMLDDDLAFFVRADPEKYNLKPAGILDVIRMFDKLHSYVEFGSYAHAALSPRQMNNQHFPATEKYVTRMNAVQVVNNKILRKHNIRYDDVTLMEDYHVTLSLLEKGYPNVQLVNYAWDQTRGSGASGGFSLSRTPQVQAQAAHRLAELHPEFVKVVTKTPKGGWKGLEERVDVRVQWKKAYEHNRKP